MDTYLKTLNLHHFRNYDQVALEFESGPVVLWGPNGAGKTNLLEAISMFSAGSGLRGAHIQDLLKETPAPLHPSTTWAVNMSLSSDINFGTALGFDALNRTRRIYKIQGVPIKNAAKFHDYLRIVSITPDMDHLFTDSTSARRRFIDQLITSYDPFHADNLRAYEKAVRQRLIVLKTGEGMDPLWLDALEKIMSQKNILIAQARWKLTQQLLEGQNNQIPLFPKFENQMVGALDTLIQQPLDLDIVIQQKLKENRNTDRMAGMTTMGCHRSDWQVTHATHKRLAKECSTGEQKIMLIAVILSFVHQKIKNEDILLILLLDDVIARLDLHHRMVLFEQIEELSLSRPQRACVQAFFSGTDIDLFTSMKQKQMLMVDKAQIT